MKIKELTIGDIKRVCKSTKNTDCCSLRCPLSEHLWLCLGLRNMTKKELESEVEITNK